MSKVLLTKKELMNLSDGRGATSVLESIICTMDDMEMHGDLTVDRLVDLIHDVYKYELERYHSLIDDLHVNGCTLSDMIIVEDK